MRSATWIARALEVPEVVIAVTMISVGTSLPELVTVVSSARKGLPDLALGNVVGSNLFNLLLVMGTTATYRPIPVPDDGGAIDLAANAIISVALLFVALRGRDVTRREGLLMLALYTGYVAQALSR